jgi:GAF domain-containing protein
VPSDLNPLKHPPEADDATVPDTEVRLRFEAVFASLCSRFVNLRSDQVDQEIENAQRYVCHSLGLDFSGLWQWATDSPEFLILTHVYTPPNGPVRPSRLEASESFPWTFKKLASGDPRPFILTPGKLPPEAARDEESQRFFDVKSTLVIPLTVGGKPILGVLTFDRLWTEGEWTEPLIRRLEIVAQIFGSALARRNAERTLRTSEERFDLATEAAGAGVWELNCQTGVFWASPQARRIFGFTLEEPISI